MMRRIFIAINLPVKVRKELLACKDKFSELPARWTALDNLHITLAFLGNTSAKELEGIGEIARKVAAHHAPFVLSLSQVAYGPSKEHPKMLWATGEEPEELLAFKRDIVKALGGKEEESFSLHVTLARLRAWEFQKIDLEERPSVEEEISFEISVSSVQIMESKLVQRNVEYSTIEDIQLTKKI
ncbi:MAG: RNA 2',3'-cyclic phosphodiesterase [bacterium]|nr:RNA 2',3'-cyclic phosphodiesterase [bacterium]